LLLIIIRVLVVANIQNAVYQI